MFEKCQDALSIIQGALRQIKYDTEQMLLNTINNSVTNSLPRLRVTRYVQCITNAQEDTKAIIDTVKQLSIEVISDIQLSELLTRYERIVGLCSISMTTCESINVLLDKYTLTEERNKAKFNEEERVAEIEYQQNKNKRPPS